VTNPLKMRGTASTMNKTSTASKVGSTRYGRVRACSKALNFGWTGITPPPYIYNFSHRLCAIHRGVQIGLGGGAEPPLWFIIPALTTERVDGGCSLGTSHPLETVVPAGPGSGGSPQPRRWTEIGTGLSERLSWRCVLLQHIHWREISTSINIDSWIRQ